MENVKDLLDEASSFTSFDVFVRKFKVKTNYLEYYKVVSTLERYKKKLCSPINGNDQTQDATKTLLSHTKLCKKAYQRLIEKKASTPLKSQGKWLAEDSIRNETVNWESTYSLPFWCTKETKLREFQFKLLHRRIATNDFLYKIGIKQSDSCTFCGETTENLVHLFWSCKYSNAFWKDCYQWIMQNTSKVEKFNLSGALLFGLINDAKDLLLHHLLLIARHYIYTCKERDTRPNVQMYIQIVQRTVEIERQIAKDRNSLDT